jgi:hypothetical protein
VLGADAVTPETQDEAAADGGFITYDELRGPDLDAALWSPARVPFPTGGEHLPLDPRSNSEPNEDRTAVISGAERND